MAAPIQVGTTATLISRTAAKPYLINNDGTLNVYLGQDTAVNANNYAFILQPGQSLSWSEINKEVWAITLTGTAKVSIAYEAAAVASSTVNISNATIPVTGTVNANITNASIPVSGSVAISSGTVSVSAGTVSVSSGNITAAVGNTPVLLSTNTINIAANANPFTFPSTVDVSAYSSLIAKISTTKTSGGATAQTLAAGAFMTITISQNNTSTPTVLALSKNAQFTFPPTGATDNNTNQTLQTAVTGKYATIAGTVFQTAAGYFVGTATLELYGSYETISQDRYSNIFTPLTTIPGAPLAGIMLAEITTATSTDYDISSKNNIATITLASGSTTNTRSALNISTYYSGASYFLTNLALVSPGLTTLDYGEKDNVTFPMLPVHVTFRQTGATPQSRYSVVQ